MAKPVCEICKNPTDKVCKEVAIKLDKTVCPKCAEIHSAELIKEIDAATYALYQTVKKDRR